MPTPSEYLGRADEITIESDEGSFVLWFATENGTYRVNVHSAAGDLYEAVQRRIEPWWAEGEAVRKSFTRDMEQAAKDVEREYAARRVFACDPEQTYAEFMQDEHAHERMTGQHADESGYALDDPKHPDWHSVHADHYYDDLEKI